MAKKWQKIKTYTAEFRKNTVKKIEQTSLAYISKKYKVNIKTLNSWQINFKKGILNTPKSPKESFGKKDFNYYKVSYELKKDPWILQLNKQKIVSFIKENRAKYSLKLLLDITGLKRSYWNKYKNYLSNGKDNEPLKNIVKVYEKNLKQFEYRRITKYLKEDYDVIYNAKKVLRIMNENNIQAEYIKRMRKKILIKKAKNKNIIKYPDLVNRKFNKIKEKIKVLFTDVAYLIWNGKKNYQSTIIDGCNKEIVDVQWSKYNDNKIVMNNLDATVNKIKQTKKDLSNIIIHSDHGFQYTSKIYNNKCISN
ncbi:MAG: IS3 family transposase [Spiroplasma phoeniceum]|nr:MAG: IS3 family transposase [Spiroplasma phoeniceum]UZQ32700.1 MAG: IS3 family transposase [Spiroplasma phoeniceum]